MSTCKIAVCDDDPAQIQYLSAKLNTWAQKRDVLLQIAAFHSAESFLFQYADEKNFDILLLDIEMGKMNGVELAKKVREGNKEVQIVFITGYMEYISAGYDVEALHYLLKPVTEEKLFSVLDRAREHLKNKSRYILFHTGSEAVRIPLYEIRYLEVRQNYVTIHADEDYTMKKPLRELEKQLDDSFFRTGRSCLVNLHYIKKITKTDVYLKDNTALPLSRGLYDTLNQTMIRYF